MKLQEIRQTSRIKLLIFFFATFLLSMQSCAQKSETKTEQITKPDYSNVDYSIGSNIIENPEKLMGDEKAIFYDPYFLVLNHEEAKNLEPLKIKEEFAKLGITLKEDERFGKAYSFYVTLTNHKKSCENFAYFDFLKPKSGN